MAEKSSKSNKPEKKDLNIPQPDICNISLYADKCVVCYHLFPTYKKARHYHKCHYTKGNEDCPAQGIQFTLLTKSKKQKRAYNLASSLYKGDLNSSVKMLQKMLHLSKTEQQEIINLMFEMERENLENQKDE